MGTSYTLNIIKILTQLSKGMPLDMGSQGIGWEKRPEERLTFLLLAEKVSEQNLGGKNQKI